MTKKKILMLNHNVEWRGTFQRCYDFAKLMVDRGHQVTILTNHPSARTRFDEYDYEGIQIVRTPDLLFGPLRSGWDPVNVIRRNHYLRNKTYDLIHVFDNRPTVILPALKLQKRLQCPLISDWCDWWGRGGAIRLRDPKILNRLFEPIETFFEEHYRKYADYLTVISEPIKERAIGLGFPKEKISTIPPLVNTEKIQPVDKSEARKRLGLEKFDPIFIFSSFVLYDLNLIEKALRIFVKKIPNCLLLLTGGVPKKQLAAFKDLPVRYAGFVPEEEFVYYLGAADLCLLPLSDVLTNRVRYPHKIGHYLAAGRPVLSNPVGEVARLIKHYDVGLLTASTPEDFAKGMQTAVDEPAHLASKGFQARLVAETKLSGAPFADKLERIYQACLKAS